jgi:serine phosphatase RsbU (regulator of sigma subunit)
MRKSLAILLLLAPIAAHSQSLITIAPRECVWHAGDNPVWAAQDFDDSAWPSYAQWKPDPNQASLWIRCHADLSALRALSDPAILAGAGAADEVFVDGREIGRLGNLRTGFYDGPLANAWPLPRSLATPSAAIAVHVLNRQPGLMGSLVLLAGSRAALVAQRDAQTLASAKSGVPMAVCFMVVGVVGFALLGLFLSDRSRLDMLALGLNCLALCVLRLLEFASSVGNSVSTSLFWTTIPYDISQIVAFVAPILLYFLIAKKRIPLFIWPATGALLLWPLSVLAGDLASADAAVRVRAVMFGAPVFPAGMLIDVSLELCAACMAFLPWRRLPRNIQWIAALWLVRFAADSTWLAMESFSRQGSHGLFDRWYAELADIRAITLLAVVVAMLVLLLLDQRRIACEQALLAGEMQAARTIQSILAPVTLDTIPGVHLGAAFHPMQEVGGDFYLCRVLPNGRQRILLGDVSGKGTAAAMTAALLIGAAEDRDADDPSVLLHHLHAVLRSSRVGGLATCLCADVSADGSMKLANAGHLSPYRNGEEVPMPGSLPLGVASAAEYPEIALCLTPGDRLTFLSDGIVEARSFRGELFGFDRTRAISIQSADQIVRAAQVFGQQDDITVLTLTFGSAEVLHA